MPDRLAKVPCVERARCRADADERIRRSRRFPGSAIGLIRGSKPVTISPSDQAQQKQRGEITESLFRTSHVACISHWLRAFARADRYRILARGKAPKRCSTFFAVNYCSHLNISTCRGLQKKNSSDLSSRRRLTPKSDEFFFCNPLDSEIWAPAFFTFLREVASFSEFYPMAGRQALGIR